MTGLVRLTEATELARVEARVEQLQRRVLWRQGQRPPVVVGSSAVPRRETLLVASNQASDEVKEGADYVCDGIGDEVEIQDAVDSLTGGGTIQLVGGEFLFDAGVFVPTVNEGIIIRGEGAWADTMIEPRSSTFDDESLIRIDANAGVVEDLRFGLFHLVAGVPPGGWTQQSSVQVASRDYCRVTRCGFALSGGVYLNLANDCLVEDCSFSSIVRSPLGAVRIRNGNNNLISRCTFYGPTSATHEGPSVALEMTGANHRFHEVRNCTFAWHRNGTEDLDVFGGRGCVVADNYFSDGIDIAIRLAANAQEHAVVRNAIYNTAKIPIAGANYDNSIVTEAGSDNNVVLANYADGPVGAVPVSALVASTITTPATGNVP